MESAVDQLCKTVEGELGVHMMVRELPDGLILMDIERGDGAPGSGKAALTRLCAYADAAKLPIYLAVMGFNETLIAMYGRFGFVIEEPSDDEDDGDTNMVRRPGGTVMESEVLNPKLTRKHLGIIAPARLPATSENIERAKQFVLKKWIERFQERYPSLAKDPTGPDYPRDLSNSCKFTSLFAQAVFGGRLRGNEGHQFVELEDGQRLDLNADAEDVLAIRKRFERSGLTGWHTDPDEPSGFVDYHGDPHAHDPAFFGNRDHVEAMRSVVPRVKDWVQEFISEDTPSR
jgi:hypothetical protein